MALLGYTTLSSNTVTTRLLLLVESKILDKNQYYFDMEYFQLNLEDMLYDTDIVYILNRHFDTKQLNYRAELSPSLHFSYFYWPQWKNQIKVYKVDF
jgi:hypothetical protein